ILHKKVAESDQLRARFEQEAHAVNAFRHPGVVEIRDVDTTEDGAPFLVMELLEGKTLRTLLNQRRLTIEEVLTIARDVAEPLGIDVVRAAWGIERIVNANMANAVRKVLASYGADPRDLAMIAYGGNGPVHAWAQARELGIHRVQSD
ncbi:MAG: hypothetical protein C4320_06220, partial [Armatimonadota bacterium]